MDTDFLVKIFIVSLVSFLILEALLPKQYRYLSFLFLVLEATILWVLGMVRYGLGPVSVTARLLITYIALSALIIDEKQTAS